MHLLGWPSMFSTVRQVGGKWYVLGGKWEVSGMFWGGKEEVSRKSVNSQ